MPGLSLGRIMESAAGLPFHPWQTRTMQRHLIVSLSVVVTFFAACGLRAADLIDEVPNDALGFVYAHNLAAVDAKIGQLSATIQHNLPRPLELARQVTGVREGIKTDGDFLVVLFPESGDNGGPIRFCVWVPVVDYDRFLSVDSCQVGRRNCRGDDCGRGLACGAAWRVGALDGSGSAGSARRVGGGCAVAASDAGLETVDQFE